MIRRIGLGRIRLRKGAVACMVAASMTMLCGVMALTLDAGITIGERRRAQAVADASAHAAADSLKTNYEMDKGLDPSGSARAAALEIASKNGYANDTTTSTVELHVPPSSGQFRGQEGYAEAIVSHKQPRLFSAVWGAGSMTVKARAVARGLSGKDSGSGSGSDADSGEAYSPSAILVLERDNPSITLSGTTRVTAIGGDVTVNSTSEASITSSGAPWIAAPVLNLFGKIRYSGADPNHALTTNKKQPPTTPDPLENIPTPKPDDFPTRSSKAITLSGSQFMTLEPGRYKGAINLSGSSRIVLNPGKYYMECGINLSGLSGIKGDGVFIYNTGGAGINLSGTGDIILNPMSSGDYNGITIFQDRDNTASATLSGGTNIKNSGTFYFPNANVALSGSSGVSVVGAQFISKTLTFSGTSGVNIVYDTSVAKKPGTGSGTGPGNGSKPSIAIVE